MPEWPSAESELQTTALAESSGCEHALLLNPRHLGLQAHRGAAADEDNGQTTYTDWLASTDVSPA